jgi:hypothetical protein
VGGDTSTVSALGRSVGVDWHAANKANVEMAIIFRDKMLIFMMLFYP